MTSVWVIWLCDRIRTQILPAFQLSGTGKVTEVSGGASHLLLGELASQLENAAVRTQLGSWEQMFRRLGQYISRYRQF